MSFNLRNILYKILDRTKRSKGNNDKPVESPFERCVMCGELTTVRKDTHIDFRDNYEIGFGQMCYQCSKKTNDDKPSCGNEEMNRLLDQLRKK